jgi:hypothetical protein
MWRALPLLNFSGHGSCRLQLSVCGTFQRPFPLTQRNRPWCGSRCPSHQDQCGARSARARQAGLGIWPGAPERTRGPRLHCVRRPPEPRRRRRTTPSQGFPFLPAYENEKTVTARHPSERHDSRPETPLQRSALLRRVSRCVERALAARMYLFPPAHRGQP